MSQVFFQSLHIFISEKQFKSGLNRSGHFKLYLIYFISKVDKYETVRLADMQNFSRLLGHPKLFI